MRTGSPGSADSLDVVHGAGGKRHGKARGEAGEFLVRLGGAAHRLATVEDTGEQARGLEELELVTALEQSFF